jgi:hypothetical protein
LDDVVETRYPRARASLNARHTGVRPPMGGARLTLAQLNAVAAYVFALSHSDGA